MTFLNVPNEVILLLIPHLEYESDINALSRTTRRLHELLNPILYRHSVKQRNGGYTLEWAAITGSTSTARLILEAGAPPDACGCQPLQPFALAAIYGHCEIIELLHEYGVDPLSTDSDWENHQDHVERGNDRGSWEKGHPISIAAAHGHVSVVNLLLRYGVPPDLPTRNFEERTALHLASEKGHLDVVHVLADAGSSINVQDAFDYVPLTLAARKGHLNIVQFLLSRGADPNITTEQQGTPLHMAALSGDINIATRNRFFNYPAPHWTDTTTSSTSSSPVDFLLTRFDCVKYFTEPDEQAVLLCVAAMTSRISLLTDLLTKHDYSPDLCITDVLIFLRYISCYSAPKSALTWAAERNQPAAIDILLSHGASITLPAETPTALFRAIKNGHKEATATILASGANINDPPGEALSIAVTNPPMFSLLLSHDADPTTPLPDSSLLAEILYSGNVETLRIFLDHPKGLELVFDPLPAGDRNGPSLVPLFYAALEGGEGVLRLLLDRGLLTPPTELDDRTAMKYLDLAVRQGGVSLMRLLLDIGFDVHAGHNAGELLHQAAISEVIYQKALAEEDPGELLDFLLQNGCSIDDTDHLGRTALFLASYDLDKDGSVMRQLLDRGADPLVDCMGAKVLPVAVKEENAGAVKVLLEALDERALGLGEIEELLKQAENVCENDRDIPRLLDRFYWRRRYPVSTSTVLSLVS
ncbi:hypothetical protein PENCOP_c002G04392 [Penicillium coprophilum]|uniref:F-box domain-containing protein n=1 Tax=Penicillium coprophilum TaxID=36646 RepID=A0A1V6V1D5_9EURO|nr:hypothetical protein PENCOP_c002G04392 [Penicillium coprophilum]